MSRAERDWVDALRAQFPVTGQGAFFDIAYENCGAAYMREALNQYLQDKTALSPFMKKNGGGGKGATVDVIAETRAALAAFLHAPGPENIAFLANTCQAISTALMGLRYQPGDNVVVGAMEHVSVLMPCLHLQRQGVECRVVGRGSDLWVTSDALLAAADCHTRVIAVSLVQSCSGYRIDIEHLTRGAHKRGILVVTDAIQALGLTEVDVQKLGVDALAGSPYKGMLGTEGVGFLYCTKELLCQLEPVFLCYSEAVDFDRQTGMVTCTQPLQARKLEAGTLPFMAIYVLQAALAQMERIGIASIAAHVSECYEYVYRALTELGFRLATPMDAEHRCNSLLLCTERNNELVQFLAERKIYISSGKTGYVRISIAPFTVQADMDCLIRAMADWRSQS